MALSLFAKALVGIFALQAKQAIGEPNKPAACVVYDAEGFGFTDRNIAGVPGGPARPSQLLDGRLGLVAATTSKSMYGIVCRPGLPAKTAS